jgi:hypothetical protein
MMDANSAAAISACIDRLGGSVISETATAARNRPWRMGASLKALVHRAIRGNAGTPTLLAANPQVAGRTGLHWHECQIQANELVTDSRVAGKLWEVSDQLIARLSGQPLEDIHKQRAYRWAERA